MKLTRLQLRKLIRESLKTPAEVFNNFKTKDEFNYALRQSIALMQDPKGEEFIIKLLNLYDTDPRLAIKLAVDLDPSLGDPDLEDVLFYEEFLGAYFVELFPSLFAEAIQAEVSRGLDPLDGDKFPEEPFEITVAEILEYVTDSGNIIGAGAMYDPGEGTFVHLLSGLMNQHSIKLADIEQKFRTEFKTRFENNIRKHAKDAPGSDEISIDGDVIKLPTYKDANQYYTNVEYRVSNYRASKRAAEAVGGVDSWIQTQVKKSKDRLKGD